MKKSLAAGLRGLAKSMKVRRPRRRLRGGATIVCELCDARTKVKRTTRVGNVVHRERQCAACGHRQRTREVVSVDEVKETIE